MTEKVKFLHMFSDARDMFLK